MTSKDTVFQQLVSLIASTHEMHFDLTRNMPMDGLTPLQYEILEYLSVQQPITLSELSECKGISMPNMSREIRKLTEKGLCEKIDDPEDRRKQHIRLSESGENRIAQSFAYMRELVMQRFEGMSEDELSSVSKAMEILGTTMFRQGR
ncbi:MarR family transcriptional regulator [Paenibacillus sp. HB172176]|uniref:MarR family winged helix-turn-helix transcriptional regulator n=1 Tax=Paenibacillus sp. HB172176 TaxID=2493690 RepID=UPI00143C9AA2|nr:MarR family transcriptional regulator [Paenibacillus sp. HB172176]